MGIAYGVTTNFQATKGIVQDGLVFNIDAAVKQSYNNGTTCQDLTLGNVGTLTNMDSSNFSKTNGGSLSFDGSNERIVYSNCPEYDFADANFTACCIFRSTQVQNYRGFCGKIQLGNGTSGWTLQLHSGKIRSWIADQYLDSPSNYNDGEWHHACAVHEEPSTGTRYIYVDGQLVATGLMPNHGYTFSNVDMWVGGWGSTSYMFNGEIASLNLYNRALTAAEVSRNFNVMRHRFGI